MKLQMEYISLYREEILTLDFNFSSYECSIQRYIFVKIEALKIFAPELTNC